MDEQARALASGREQRPARLADALLAGRRLVLDRRVRDATDSQRLCTLCWGVVALRASCV